MAPADGPTGPSIVAQLTVPTGTLDATLNAQGRSNGGADDWQARNIQYELEVFPACDNIMMSSPAHDKLPQHSKSAAAPREDQMSALLVRHSMQPGAHE